MPAPAPQKGRGVPASLVLAVGGGFVPVCDAHTVVTAVHHLPKPTMLNGTCDADTKCTQVCLCENLKQKYSNAGITATLHIVDLRQLWLHLYNWEHTNHKIMLGTNVTPNMLIVF